MESLIQGSVSKPRTSVCNLAEILFRGPRCGYLSKKEMHAKLNFTYEAVSFLQTIIRSSKKQNT
jgi:hypothetical protein